MANQVPLKYMAWSITPSVLAMAGANRIQGHRFATHLPLVDIKLDFENGNFFLEGDWHFMMAANRHVERSWFACHSERVKIETSIFPSTVINLSDRSNDGSGFSLEGTLKDGNSMSKCFGLLVLEFTEPVNGLPGNEWNLTFYLYDAMNSECEIRMKLPIYADTVN